MKRIVEMGMVLCLCLLASAPAEAHVKRYATRFHSLSADASEDSIHVGLDVDKIDCAEGRTVNIYDHTGKLRTSGTPSAGVLIASYPFGVGDVITIHVTKLVLKKSTRHTHLCKGRTEDITATP